MIVTIKKKLEETLIPEHLRAAGIIPVLAYDEDDHVFLMDDHSAGFGFMCEPLCGADEKVQERMNGFLNQEFPSKTTLQFVLFRSPDINQEMYRMMGLRDGFRHELLTSVIKERINFLQHHTTDRIFAKTNKGIYDNGLIQDLKLFVTCKVPIKNNNPTESELQQLAQLRTKVESSLQTVGLRPRTMTAVNYIRIMSTILNWGPDASWRHDSVDWEMDKPICEQIFDYGTDVEVSKNGIRLGDYHAKVMSAKKLPDVFYFGDALTYAGDLSGGNSSIKENYMVVTNVFFPEAESTKNTLERKRQFTVNQAYGPMLKFVPVLADKKESFDTLYESMKEGAKPVKITYSVVLFAPTKERVEAAAMAARNIWRESRFELMEDKFVALPMFLNCLPFCTDRDAVRDLFRYKTMTTEQAAVVLPVFGEWKGTGTYHAALISRNGQLMSLSLHDSNTNKNLVIAAESGSGKSFLTNELIFSYLSEGAQVWVIDAGKSYQKLSEMLNGDFVHFEEGTHVCLNPFELIQNYEDEEDAIVSLVCAMASAKGLLDEWQISALKQVLSRLWEEKGKEMKVDDIAERCLEDENDQRLKDIGQQLYAFTSKGSYGKYFSRKNNVSFQNQFTVLELDELQGRKHLRQVVLLQLIYQIQQEVFLGERNRKKVVIVDEAWDLLKEGEVSVFMEHAYRKFRKYGGSVVIATQSINDLYENAVGRAIAENSASMYLLGQTEETVESVKRSGRLTLSEGGFHTLKTVHTIQGVYSEIFIKSKSGMGVGRLIVGDFQKLLYSTDPVDVNAIDQFVKQGMSIPEAIKAVMRSRQQAA
ncbi:TPA: type IV secretion system protein TraC [Vibrio parahaemolyticus]|uniref:Type IV secretion system protein TraC n=1 Tax=Salmonella typhimurium TaxID=90371 RepID=A0A709JKZ1_SALTM|nr:type IV secretion system protein TraC [Salmonella enterica]HAD0265578.1 type IV secretion system protein TraC [Salmonella enterica subsp. enterica serovar Typhimurium]HCJ7040808.1 type IV secretion system protein TraC [Vibrio cholerae]WKT24544.1 type IV secretion system protein TraC [Salmonella enterica subsp. enterica serovar 1,4,12:i:-]HAD0266764.1 type IV secretion system protein TraC [Salmonella enterica subsp. enterica serovar Typhimurium]HAD0322648.1 type IV secretion system protein T